MKSIFFGTDAFAREILACLLEKGIEIKGVVTRPDKPKGRSLHLSPSPVKEWLQKEKKPLPIFTPVRASDPSFIAEIAHLQPDLFIVVSYGQLIKEELLRLPKIGAINVHPSLLPKYRGASPMQSALLNGEEETGVTIMEMVLAMDAGGILSQTKVKIDPNTTLEELEELLCQESKKSLLEVLAYISKHHALPPKREQEEALVTFTKKVEAEDAWIDWNQGASKIHNQVRAMNPRPGAKAKILQNGEEKILKIWKTEVVEAFTPHANRGEILSYDRKNGWVVACAVGSLRLLEVQLEGKKKVSALEYQNGFVAPLFV